VATQRFYAAAAPLSLDAARVLFTLAFVAVLLGAVLSLPVRDLWEPDEARIALVASETIASGNWLVPRLLGEPYTQKPPLYVWAVALLRLAGLPWTWAAVLPSLLALLGLVALAPRLARTLGLGREVGLLGGAMLAAMPLFVGMGLGARMDVPLALTFTASLLPLARLLGVGEPPRPGDHLRLWLLIGIGILIKGPVALAMPAATTLTFSLVARPRPRLRPVLAGWGPVLALVVVLAWLAPAAVAVGGGYLRELVVTQSAGRMVGSFAHRQPLYYHFLTFPFTALPWSIAALVAAVRAFRRRAGDAEAFLAAVPVGLLVLFSLFSGKIIIYLLPAFPTVALLVAAALQRDARGYRAALVAGGLGVALGGALLLYRTLQGTWLIERQPTTAAAAVLLCLVGLLAAWLASRRRVAPGPAPLILAGLLVAALVLPSAVLSANRELSTRGIAEALARLEPDPVPFVVCGIRPYGVALRLGRPIVEVESAAAAARALLDGRCIVLSRRQWQTIEALPEIERLAPARERVRFRHKEFEVACPPGLAQR
jgi:4-amino-4-deoxy-L-arabinose transferase-like glycosyltransferase